MFLSHKLITSLTLATAIASGCGVGTLGEPQQSPFRIQLNFRSPLSEPQASVIGRAAARWGEVVIGDKLDRTILASNIPKECLGGRISSDTVINGLLILVESVEIDGVGDVLAVAGPCAVRSTDGSPLVGKVQFDRADVADLEARGQLYSVALHEIGHVFGFGSVWSPSGLLRDPSLPDHPGADTHFAGKAAIRAFDAAGGAELPASMSRVPVDNSAVAGSADSHWREEVLGDELMSPIIDGGDNAPLSAITVASLEDLGFWIVDTAAADDYAIGPQSRRRMTAATPYQCLISTPIVVDVR